MKKSSAEFYIGSSPNAPVQTARFLKRMTIASLVVLTIIGGLLALSQREFSESSFEYGKLTTLTGVLYQFPLPHLKTDLGTDQRGNLLKQTILLVNRGKKGFEGLFAKNSTHPLDGAQVEVKGYLMYGDGKALVQINDPAHVKLTSDAPVDPLHEMGRSSAVALVSGEIVDPKCYFGVMKPGEGKPHRSCAIRCIAGGIPPVFKSVSSEYFLLTGDDGLPVNQQILDIVGDRINLEGEIIELDDWKILKVNRALLKLLANKKSTTKFKDELEKGITMCDN